MRNVWNALRFLCVEHFLVSLVLFFSVLVIKCILTAGCSEFEVLQKKKCLHIFPSKCVFFFFPRGIFGYALHVASLLWAVSFEQKIFRALALLVSTLCPAPRAGWFPWQCESSGPVVPWLQSSTSGFRRWLGRGRRRPGENSVIGADPGVRLGFSGTRHFVSTKLSTCCYKTWFKKENEW